MNKLYAYIRASTNEQKETLATQQEILEKEYHHRFEKDYEWGGAFVDGGVSGSVQFRSRPQGFRLNTALEKGDAILMTKLDRGFRNLLDLAEMLELWIARGVRLVMLDINMDLGTPVGKMIAQILGAVAEFERARLRERIREGHARAKREGRPRNQRAPYGFKWVGPDKKHKKLVPDPYTRSLARKFIEWHQVHKMSRERIWSECLRQRIRQRNNKEIGDKTIENWITWELRLQAFEAAEAAKENAQSTTKENTLDQNPNGK